MDAELATLSARIGSALKARGWRLVTAESCTGGWIAEAVTATAGSSDWFDCGFVTYSNASKTTILGVSPDLLARHGAVSEPVVRAMAAGALAASPAEFAIAVTGIAGPGGGSADKPVGTVHFAFAIRHGRLTVASCRFEGDREQVRRASVAFALAEAARGIERKS